MQHPSCCRASPALRLLVGQRGRCSICKQIGLRMAQGLERLNNSNSGMCAIYRGSARIYRQTRSELTAAGCPMAGFDEAIRQTEAGARGACE